MKAAVLYHKADLDGVLSGVIANFYLSLRYEEVKCIGSDYHLKINLEELKGYDQIYVIDFSNDDLFKSELANKIIWIDHHVSAIEKYRELKLNQWCIDGVAACRLALQFFRNLNYSFLTKADFFHRQVEEHLLVALAGECDIWDLTSPCAMPLNFGIADISFENVNSIYKSTKNILTNGESKNSDESRLEELNEAKQIEGWESSVIYNAIQRGKGVIDYINSTSTRVPPNHILLDGKVGRVFNTSIKSSLIHTLQPEEDFIMVWYHLGKNRVTISFYSDKVDCYKLAQQFGGGGHKGAAGCSVDLFTLGNILFSK